MIGSPVNNPGRTNTEAISALVWVAAALAMVLAVSLSIGSWGILGWIEAVLVPLAVWRGLQGWRMLSQRLNYGRFATRWVSVQEIMARLNKRASDVWMGFGFDWTPEHTQRAYDIRNLGVHRLKPPRLVAWIDAKLRREQTISHVGEPWIHSIGREADVYTPLRSMVGNTMIFGVPGSGKTRLSELLIVQAIHRGDVVIVVDPKGDKDTETRMRAEAKKADRPYVYFHPAHVEASVRLNPLQNWHRATELASRLAAIIPSETGSDAFTAFGWMTLETVINGLVLIGVQPTILEIKRHTQGGPDWLLERGLEVWLSQYAEGWESRINAYMDKADKNKRGVEQSPRLLAMIRYYQQEGAKRNPDVDSLIHMTLHNREHYTKMIASLLPVLDMLTAGDLAALLSPDVHDNDDTREIWDAAKMINLGAVAYIGLDTLSDATVGSAIGSMFMSELASVAGAKYNFEENHRRVTVMVDEAAEVLNQPFVQTLNKGRGAGFELTVLTQTYSDLAARLGSADKARMVAGNTNNLIVLRTRDAETQKYAIEQFGKIAIKSISSSHGNVAGTEQAGLHFAGSVSESMSDREVDAFPPDLLGKLPDLNYIAAVSGGRLIKGRLPLIHH